MNKNLRVSDYLEHIQQALERVHNYTAGLNKTEFLDRPMIQDAVIRNLEILGEAARNIERCAPEFAARHAEIPWPDIYLMRNRLAHGYFAIDFEIVWNAIRNDLPILEQQIKLLRQEN